MVLSWLYHGFIIVFSWRYHGVIMVFIMAVSWLYHGRVMVLSWFYHGFILVEFFWVASLPNNDSNASNQPYGWLELQPIWRIWGWCALALLTLSTIPYISNFNIPN